MQRLNEIDLPALHGTAGKTIMVDNKSNVPHTPRKFQFNFDDIPVSTRTFTASSNLSMDIEKIAKILPVVDPDTQLPRRKKRTQRPPPDRCTLEPGTIINVNYMGVVRGATLKHKKSSKRWFRNSFSIVVYLDKFINFKICSNGTFQITGALHFQHAVGCIKSVWGAIKHEKRLYSFSDGGETLKCLIIPAMRNLDFNLGIKINRESLDEFVSTRHQNYHCLLESSFGYTGLNVKRKITTPIENLQILKVHLTPQENDDEWVGSTTRYKEYLDLLPTKLRQTKLDHVRYNTWLIFHSGKIIQSGLSEGFMKDHFNDFIDLINEAHAAGKLEEVLDTSPIQQA
jgi:hypothetical protein